MMSFDDIDFSFDSRGIISAEEFPDNEFEKYHTFLEYEDKIIRRLIAHGPLLLSGSRGTGKSALLKEAYLKLKREPFSSKIFGVYISLRYIPLLRLEGSEYEEIFCEILNNHIVRELEAQFADKYAFEAQSEVSSIQEGLVNLSQRMSRRIVLFFDDAAHIGRETSVRDFFDIFRTLSSNATSCKAAIYPGVTEFGPRFDLLNDAIVVNVNRTEDMANFNKFFEDIIVKRYGDELDQESFTVPLEQVASLLGRAVIGNVRAFIKACNFILDRKVSDKKIGLPDIDETLKAMATEHFWASLDELEPKLGCFMPLIEPTRSVAETLIQVVSRGVQSSRNGASFIIHKNYTERLKKLFEMLEYVGFISKREASRKLKSGGRGPRYTFNLCVLMDELGRLSHNTVESLIMGEDSTEIYRNEALDNIYLPEPSDQKDLEIFNEGIEKLVKSAAYPYGLTTDKIARLKESGIHTVKELAEATDEKLLSIHGLKDAWLKRIRDVVGQAVWM